MRRTDAKWLVTLLVLYLAVGIPLGARCVNQLNPDGVSYLLLAEHYAKGEWGAAVVGHWSPLLPWLISLLLRMGIAPLVAARSILLLSGLGLTLAAWLLFGRLGLSRLLRCAATAAIAVMALDYSVALLTPDLLVAALLAVYFWQSLDAGIVERPSAAFKCGLVAGVAYLAKAYAFPFFILHFSVLAVVYSRRAGPGVSVRALRTIGLGLAGAAVFVLPWATAISVKYGFPAITTAPRLRSEIGPDGQSQLAHLVRLYHPRAERLNAWEDPYDGTILYPAGLLISDLTSLKRHIQKINGNLKSFRAFVGQMAGWGIMSIVLVCVLLLVVSRRGEEVMPLSWAVWTVIAYASGYIIFHAIPRYFIPLAPVLVAMAFLLLQVLVAGPAQQGASAGMRRSRRRRAYLAAALLAVPFLMRPAANIRWHFVQPPEWGDAYVAQRLSSLSVRSPLAASEWYYGLYVSYRLRMKYLGRPASEAPDEMVAELQAAGVATFLVWDDAALAEALDQQAGLRRMATISLPPPLESREVIVFDVLAQRDAKAGESVPSRMNPAGGKSVLRRAQHTGNGC